MQFNLISFSLERGRDFQENINVGIEFSTTGVWKKLLFSN